MCQDQKHQEENQEEEWNYKTQDRLLECGYPEAYC